MNIHVIFFANVSDIMEAQALWLLYDEYSLHKN